jgi:hypothetical protein
MVSASPFRLSVFILSIFCAVLIASGCGGGNSGTPAVAPVFSSSAPTYAAEGETYAYTLSASGVGVSYSLATAPAGATISVATITWTPTHRQVRRANSFTVLASSSKGASSSQSFTVTPVGTVQGTFVDTYWGTVRTTKPFDLSTAEIKALVPNGSGGFTTYHGTGAVDGTFSIPKVPAGYYWLEMIPIYKFWTSATDFDAGAEFIGRYQDALPFSTTANVNLTNASLEGNSRSLSAFAPFAGSSAHFYNLGIYSSTVSSQSSVSLPQPIDAALGDTTYVLEEVTEPGVTTYNRRIVRALGPTSLTFRPDLIVDVVGDLGSPNPATFHSYVDKTGFAQSISGNSPNARPLGFLTSFSTILDAESTAPLIASRAVLPLGQIPLASLNCNVADDAVNAELAYVNPFPDTWKPVYSAYQTSGVVVASNEGSSFGIGGTTGYTTQTAPTAAAPFNATFLNPQNPKIDGVTLYLSNTISVTPTVTWEKPAGPAASGYWVIFTELNPTGTFPFSPGAFLSTSTTSITVPPGTLKPGQQYVLGIYAISDPLTDFESAPFRGSLEHAMSSTVSNLLTTSGGTPTNPSQAAQPSTAPKECSPIYLLNFDGIVKTAAPGCPASAVSRTRLR